MPQDGVPQKLPNTVELPFSTFNYNAQEAWRVFGKDFWAYGLAPNRPTFEAIGRYVHEQGLSPRVVSADELFVMNLE